MGPWNYFIEVKLQSNLYDEIELIHLKLMSENTVKRFICIHSKDAKLIECIETMTADTSKSSVCGEQNGLMKIAMITTSLKYKVDTLCGPGQFEINECNHI